MQKDPGGNLGSSVPSEGWLWQSPFWALFSWIPRGKTRHITKQRERTLAPAINTWSASWPITLRSAFESKIWHKGTSLKNRTGSQTQGNRPVVAGGTGQQRISREPGIIRGKHIIHRMDKQQDLAHSTGNYTQYPGIKPQWQRIWKRMYIYKIHICITESLYCVAKFNTTCESMTLE